MAAKGQPKTGGRKPGTPNKATAEVRDIAKQYAPAALKELARLSTKAESEQARVSAINSLLDRAYGKPTQLIGGDQDAAPILHEIRRTLVRSGNSDR